MEEFVIRHLVWFVTVTALSPVLLGFAGWLAVRHLLTLRRYRPVTRIDSEVRKKKAQLSRLGADYKAKHELYEKLKQALSHVQEEADAVEYGLYSPHFDFDTSERYRSRLEEVRKGQKTALKERTAARCDVEITVSGSKGQGRKLVERYIKLMLRAFNSECDAAVQKVRWNNAAKMEERIGRAFTAINKLGESHQIAMTDAYLRMKIDELRLAHEYAEKLKEEKEEQRRIREQMREEERVRREIEKEEREAEAEEVRYGRALERARRELEARAGEESLDLRRQIAELEEKLETAHYRKERALSRAQMTKEGHVYVISNIGCFGEGTFKIGMTRRLEPMDRVKELGDASVPFGFDVHAMIHSDDAPALETQLHKEFHDRRRNLVNMRKEFFEVTLDQIESAVEKLHGKIEFTRAAEAREYRETVAMRSDRAADSALREVVGDELPAEL